MPTPPPIAGHQPDVLARGFKGGRLIIGLARIGAELDDPASVEMYRAFTEFRDPESDELAVLALVVPKDQKQEVEAVLDRVGLDPDSYSVTGVSWPTP